MFREILKPLYPIREYIQLPRAVRVECRKDFLGLPEQDPGIEKAIDEGIAWLCRAQDKSTSQDGGVARHFSLISGWSASYPETTGYIAPTILEYARMRRDETARQRAQRMLEWLVSIQLPDGGFQGGLIDSTPIVPVTFNTGQILIGLASGVREFEDNYLQPMCRAADWLVETQDPDGCWHKNPTPFAKKGKKSYETHVAWGLLEAARIKPDKGYAEAALANVSWALHFQKENGWFDKCCLSEPSKPLTHTLGYVFRGILEAYRYTNDPMLLNACTKTADGLLAAIRKDGFLPGRLYPNWRAAASWACLTGTVQISYCWLMMYEFTGEARYRDAAYAANRYVRCTMNIDGPPDTRGGIKGSFPVYGGYGTYEYLNWAAKFFVDANILEKTVRQQSKPQGDE